MTTNQLILSEDNLDFIKSISPRNTLEGKRAKALLSIYDGKTMKETSENSGLTYGQVKYLLQRFRSIGLSIFPESDKTEEVIIEQTKITNKKTKKEKKKAEKRENKKKDKKKDKDKKSKDKKVKNNKKVKKGKKKNK